MEALFEQDAQGRGRYCVMGLIHKLAYNEDPDENGGNLSGNEYLEDKKVPALFFDEDGETSSIQNDLIDKNDHNWGFKKLATFIDKNL